MPVKAICPYCQKAGQISEAYLGKDIKCPGCKKVFKFPPEPPIPPSEPDQKNKITQTNFLSFLGQGKIYIALVLFGMIGIAGLVYAIATKPERDKAYAKRLEDEEIQKKQEEKKAKEAALAQAKADEEKRKKDEEERIANEEREIIRQIEIEEANKPFTIDGRNSNLFTLDSDQFQVNLRSFMFDDKNFINSKTKARFDVVVFSFSIKNKTENKNIQVDLPFKLFKIDNKDLFDIKVVDEFGNRFGLSESGKKSYSETQTVLLGPGESFATQATGGPIVKTAKRLFVSVSLPDGKTGKFEIALDQLPRVP